MNIIEEIRAFREIVLGKQDKLIPGDHIILDDDVISVDFAPVDALLDRLEEVEDDINALNFDVTELDIRLDAAEENIEDAQDHLDSVDYNINELNESLDTLKTKVDNIHGFEIVALSEGQYDPETMKPTIENPKTNTLYLVPNDDPTQRNLWIEWLWISNRWEQFGTAVIDLSEYVKKTDTPTAIVPGVVKVNRLNGVQLLSNGQLAITPANLGDVQSGQAEYLPITPVQQHNAVFYGLARASRTPALYYNAVDKTNIRLMIDAGSHAQVENLANDVEGFGIKVEQLLNRNGATMPGMVWESKIDGAGWSEAAQGRVVDVTKDGESLMDEHGIVELPDVDIPTKTSDLVNDSGFITESSLPTKVSDLENDSGFLVSADLVNYALRSEIPTKVSDLQNDSGFLTEVPLASRNVPGIVRVWGTDYQTGIKTTSMDGSSGILSTVPATQQRITQRSGGQVITPTVLDIAVKAALTDGVGPAYTSEEQAAARIRLGVTEGGLVDDVQINGASIVDENKVANIVTTGFMPKSQLLDAGIKSIAWTTNVEGTYTTVEDPLKAQRPSGTNTRYWVEMDSCPYFYHSKMYRVTFNGTVYDNLECRYGILVDEDKGEIIGSDTTVGGCWQMIGNRALYDSRYIDTGEPFAILYVEHGGMHNGGAYYYSSTAGHGILLTKSAMSVNLKIETATITKTDLPHCLDEDFGGGDKLLETTNSTYPRSSWGQGNIVGRGSFAIGDSNISTGLFALAEGHINVASGYCSSAEGLMTSATGDSSHSEGRHTLASGNNSHAEGGCFGSGNSAVFTIATGANSHAEGAGTTASGNTSHAEGVKCVANGQASHAEGNSTQANNYYVHAEGNYTIANGQTSHAEGNHTETTTDALCAHAEGNYTISNGRVQHVQGQYNIKDESDIDTTHGTKARKYLHIVGNGTSDTARSNAHTLDWNGLGWFKGGLKVGGTGQDDSNAENVVLESDLSSYALESDLEALEDRVDALHGFEIVFLTTGEYDPETGIPTILGPQEGTLYLVPSGQASPDVWTEWLWTGEAWEKFGSASIDLSNYVQKTDYATTLTAGVIKAEPFYGTAMAANGILRSVVKSYDVYNDKTHTAETVFISKGTLENVLAARIPDVPSISYDETEEMLVWQTTADDGNEVSY